MSAKGGPVFTFNLPGGRLAPPASPSVTPLTVLNFYSLKGVSSDMWIRHTRFLWLNSNAPYLNCKSLNRDNYDVTVTSKIAPSAATEANCCMNVTVSEIVATCHSSVWSLIFVEQCVKSWTKEAASHYGKRMTSLFCSIAKVVWMSPGP